MKTLFLEVGMSSSMKVFSHSAYSHKHNPHLHYKVFCPLLTLTYPFLSNIHSIKLILLLITKHLNLHQTNLLLLLVIIHLNLHQTNPLLLLVTMHLNLHQTNLLLLLVIIHLNPSRPNFFSHAKKSSTHYQTFSNRPSCSTIQSHIDPTFLTSRLRNGIPSQSFDHCPRPTAWNQVSYA